MCIITSAKGARCHHRKRLIIRYLLSCATVKISAESDCFTAYGNKRMEKRQYMSVIQFLFLEGKCCPIHRILQIWPHTIFFFSRNLSQMRRLLPIRRPSFTKSSCYNTSRVVSWIVNTLTTLKKIYITFFVFISSSLNTI